MLLTCIYCLKRRRKTSYSKREHVIHQCLGRFKQNFVLHGIVCDSCNQYFGDGIDLVLGRGSLEGFIRPWHGMKSAGKPLRKRLKTQVAPGQKMGGLIVYTQPAKDKDEPVAVFVDQICFKNKTSGQYECFELNGLPSKEEIVSRGLDPKEAYLTVEDETEVKKVQRRLKKLGLGPMKWEPKEERIGDDRSVFETEVLLDATVARALCKIAFNYLVFNTDRDFVLRREFDEVRRFIRKGEGDFRKFLKPNLPPLLMEDRQLKIQSTRGHLIILTWPGGSNKIISRLSPFNQQTYEITLCANFSGLWRPLRVGHHFDLETKEINKLGDAAGLVVLPAGSMLRTKVR